MSLEGILVVSSVVSILFLIISTRKDEEAKFKDWLNMYFIEEEVDINILRNIYTFEKDPDKALIIHNNYREDTIDEGCLHPEKTREYYHIGAYRCWECGRIITKQG